MIANLEKKYGISSSSNIISPNNNGNSLFGSGNKSVTTSMAGSSGVGGFSSPFSGGMSTPTTTSLFGNKNSNPFGSNLNNSLFRHS